MSYSSEPLRKKPRLHQCKISDYFKADSSTNIMATSNSKHCYVVPDKCDTESTQNNFTLISNEFSDDSQIAKVEQSKLKKSSSNKKRKNINSDKKDSNSVQVQDKSSKCETLPEIKSLTTESFINSDVEYKFNKGSISMTDSENNSTQNYTSPVSVDDDNYESNELLNNAMCSKQTEGVDSPTSDIDVQHDLNSPTSNIDIQHALDSPTSGIDVQDSSAIFTAEDKWKGKPLNEISKYNRNSLIAPDLNPRNSHVIFFKVPITDNEVPRPFNKTKNRNDIWDGNHVRMPCSQRCSYPHKTREGLLKKWELICGAFEKKITSVDELRRAILSYNHRFEDRWTFKTIRYLVEHDMTEEEQTMFFDQVLPGIIELAISLPDLVLRPIPLLKNKKSMSLSFSQRQIASLLANAFLCTYPSRNSKNPKSEYRKYPEINFDRLFNNCNQRTVEKLKCILHYFRQVISTKPDGVVTFTRQFIRKYDIRILKDSRNTLTEMHIKCDGFIEDVEGLLQVDFANRYIGGGVLGSGCVQEEIRFVINPELIISKLFTECLSDNEVLIVTGAERFSKYTGYADNFKFAGPYHDVTERDKQKRRICQITCIDAIYFRNNEIYQYDKKSIEREIIKAYIGFHSIHGTQPCDAGIATGNWGCGAFGGDVQLKMLIQLIAASVCGRDIVYFTFGDENMLHVLHNIHDRLTDSKIKVGDLITYLYEYSKHRQDYPDIGKYILVRIEKEFADMQFE